MEWIDKTVAQGKLRLERARARFGAVDIVVRTFRRFSQDDGGSYAAALTYYTFFSIFPILLASAAILGYLTMGNDALRDEIFTAGLEAVPMVADLLRPEAIDAIESRRGSLAITAILLALYTGSGAVIALEHALNRINHVVDESNFIQKRLRSLRWMVIFGAAALASVALGTIGNFAQSIFGSNDVTRGAAHVVPALIGITGGIAINLAMFLAAYKLLPKADLSWRDVLPGAVVAAAAFELLKFVGAWYLARGANMREAAFGTFAAAAGLLVASYLIAQIILLSAELNLVLAERRAMRTGRSKEER